MAHLIKKIAMDLSQNSDLVIVLLTHIMAAIFRAIPLFRGS